MKRRREAVARPERERAARQAAAHVLGLEELAGAHTVGLYAALDCELGTDALAAELRERGVRLAYPRVVPGQRALCFHWVDDSAQFARGTFGLLQPDPALELVAVNALDALIVPGLAFDTAGHRLGWGKGHYDATLAGGVDGLLVGYGYACQLVDALPQDAHDVSMDLVVTEAGVTRAGARTPRPDGALDEERLP